MPPKSKKTHYVCSECGERSLKWFGRCPACEGWNTLVEEIDASRDRRALWAGALAQGGTGGKSTPLAQAVFAETDRKPIGNEEIDRVLGGGVVPGSLVLLGGEPGVGKSTLLLQLCSLYSSRYGAVLYVSGEESARQVGLRAFRLGLDVEKINILSETRVEVVREAVASERPDLVVVDSIQTMAHPELDSSPGSVAQVRESCAVFAHMAKELGVSVFLVGHVNKQGSLAGPKVLEHAVDVVLSFEGEDHTSFRMLRAVKNRFGATHEVGLFEMKETGLAPVVNPSEFFLAERPKGTSGSVVTACREGSRPLLVEVQALVGQTAFGGTPRRQVAGADYNRVSIILAVLEKRLGIPLQTLDVYVNIAGGIRVSEPACDLGIAVAVASSAKAEALPSDTVVFGEIGLAGEIRSVAHTSERLAEAARLGFRKAVVPLSRKGPRVEHAGVEVVGVESVQAALAEAFRGIRSAGVEGVGAL